MPLVLLYFIPNPCAVFDPSNESHRLNAMSEIDRENVLTERFERRKALQERIEARRRARGAEGKKSSKDTSMLSLCCVCDLVLQGETNCALA